MAKDFEAVDWKDVLVIGFSELKQELRNGSRGIVISPKAATAFGIRVGGPVLSGVAGLLNVAGR